MSESNKNTRTKNFEEQRPRFSNTQVQESSRLLSARSSTSSIQPQEEHNKKKSKRLGELNQDDDEFAYDYDAAEAENYEEEYDVESHEPKYARSQLIADEDDDNEIYFEKSDNNDTTNDILSKKSARKNESALSPFKKSLKKLSIPGTEKTSATNSLTRKSSLKKSLLSQMRNNTISRRLSAVSSNLSRSNLTTLAEFKRQQQVMHQTQTQQQQQPGIRFTNKNEMNETENDQVFEEDQQALSSSSSNSFNNRGILKNNNNQNEKAKPKRQPIRQPSKNVSYPDLSSGSHSLDNHSRMSASNIQGSSVYNQVLFADKNKKPDYWSLILVFLSYFFLFASFPFSLCTSLKIAQEYERAVIFRLGRVLTTGERGPGIFFVLPCIDTYTKVDLRTVTFDVPPQEILTKDSVTVSVDAVVYFRIFNAVISVINVEDAAKSTKLLAASTLRNILGTKSLHEILSDRESVAISIQGVKVERVEVKDVRLPVQLQRAMATEAEAAREARAKVIAAEGEQKASKALKEAAEVISISPIAIQLRYLQTLTQIASEKNSTIVFPIPLEFLSIMTNKGVNLLKSNLFSSFY